MTSDMRGVPAGRSVAQWFRRVLGRETTGRTLVPQIDGLRCVAVLLVLARHVGQDFIQQPAVAADPLLRSGRAIAVALNGWVGVQLFFAISGFIVALPFARSALAGERPVRLRSYYARRVTRIEPPYVINLVLLFLLLPFLSPTPIATIAVRFKRLLFTLAYAHSLRYGQLSMINPVAWSLEVEVQFYLLAPLLVLAFRLRPAGLRRALLAIVIVVLSFVRPHLGGMVQGVTIAHQLPYFLVGFLLADLYLTDWHRPPRLPWAWDAAAVVAGLAMVAPPFHLPGLGRVYPSYFIYQLAPVEIAVLAAAAFRGRLWRDLMGWTPVYLIGGMCYSIYLYHMTILDPLIAHTAGLRVAHNGSATFLAQFALCTTVIVSGSAVLFVAFEKPFMRRDWPAAVARRLRNRFTSRAVR